MSATDLQKHVIYTTLTSNSTTLYTYENFSLIHRVNNLNCSEIVSQELGLINASKTLVGSISVATSSSVTQSNLMLYFMKKSLTNSDGSSDLLTVVAIANVNVNKMLILSILKKIMDKYISFKSEIEGESTTTTTTSTNSQSTNDTKAKLSKFKPYMYQIIKFEEMNYDTNIHAYKYGAASTQNQSQSSRYTDEESDSLFDSDVINPNQLLLANEEIDEVRQLMLDNINKVMNRGDKINNLVDQTDRLNNSSSVFQKKALTIKRKMWLNNARFVLSLVIGAAFILYLLIATECGFPFFSKCIP
ncbi:hypothetical protein CLIB1423_04S03268 [[Candida] railenensis]|uniref:V-SNARE coiled-coil homology domain-containing protein n=1 Tax=[Candida] railenensis TaxID=45579 RepID=A0A9P0VX55_9ASCO|nr:hypothetical protein CLIB1423_04S03268 [[Candida] railenensis]